MRRRTALALAATLLPGCATFETDPRGTAEPSPTDRPGTATQSSPGTATQSSPGTATQSATGTTEEPATDDPSTDEPAYELIPADPKSATAAAARDRLASVGCDGLADRTVACGDDGRLAVSVTPTVGSLPRETVEFTLHNLADEAFRWNPYGWELHKHDGNRWRPVAPLGVPTPEEVLDPGESYTYRIPLDNTTFHGTKSLRTDEEPPLSGLGPGVYGFVVDGSFGFADERFTFARTFGFSGEGPPVRPTDAVESVERDGAELVVRASRERFSGTLVVSFVDAPADARLLADHVRQVPGLLNTLPYAATPGVDAVRYAADENAVDTALAYLDLATPDGTERFGFRGYVFEARSEAA